MILTADCVSDIQKEKKHGKDEYGQKNSEILCKNGGGKLC